MAGDQMQRYREMMDKVEAVYNRIWEMPCPGTLCELRRNGLREITGFGWILNLTYSKLTKIFIDRKLKGMMEWGPEFWQLCQTKAQCLAIFWVPDNIVPMLKCLLTLKDPNAKASAFGKSRPAGTIGLEGSIFKVKIKIEWREVECPKLGMYRDAQLQIMGNDNSSD